MNLQGVAVQLSKQSLLANIFFFVDSSNLRAFLALQSAGLVPRGSNFAHRLYRIKVASSKMIEVTRFFLL